jgi:hypothetical protein
MKDENTQRMTKWRTDSIYSPKDLNLHDPHEMYRWQDEEANAPCLGVGNAGTGHCRFLCGYLCPLFTHVLILRGNFLWNTPWQTFTQCLST